MSVARWLSSALFVGILLFASLAAAQSQPQTAVVTAEGISLRDKPGFDGRAIAPLTKGAQLDLLETTRTNDGTWYRVQLRGTATVGFVNELAAEIASPASTAAQPPPPTAESREPAQPVSRQATTIVQTPIDVAGPSTSPNSQWQQEYNLATTRKNGGKKKMLIGIGAAAGGTVLAVAAAENCLNSAFGGGTCTGSSAAATLGWLANLGGSGVFIWGLVDYIDASGDLNRLNATRSGSAGLRTTIDLAESQNLDIEVGTRSSVGYRLSW